MGFGRAAGRFMLSLVHKRQVIEEAMARLDTPNNENQSGEKA